MLGKYDIMTNANNQIELTILMQLFKEKLKRAPINMLENEACMLGLKLTVQMHNPSLRKL